jgi:hypothetical protein
VQDSYLESIDAAMELDPSGASIFDRLRVELPDVHLDPDVVNAAVGSELLRVPLTVRARIEGPVDAVALDLSVDAESSSVGATLVFDLRDPAVPGYAGELELVRFRPEAWLALDGVEADTSLILRAEGRGITPDAASFRAVLDVAPSRFLGYAVEGIYASVGFAERTLTVHSLEAWSDGARLAVEGTADLDGEVAVRVSGSVAEEDAVEKAVSSAAPMAR